MSCSTHHHLALSSIAVKQPNASLSTSPMPNSGCITSVAWVRRVPALKPSRDVLVDEPDDDDAAAAAAQFLDDDEADAASRSRTSPSTATTARTRTSRHPQSPTRATTTTTWRRATTSRSSRPPRLIGALDDEMSSVEMYVYEEQHDNLYPHHTSRRPSSRSARGVRLPAGRRRRCGARAAANMLAAGTFAPHIEIWTWTCSTR